MAPVNPGPAVKVNFVFLSVFIFPLSGLSSTGKNLSTRFCWIVRDVTSV